MRPTVYFPELLLGNAVVPAYSASQVEPRGQINACENSARHTLRIETAAACYTTRRRPMVDSIVLEA